MTAVPLAAGDRVRRVGQTSPLDVRYGTATVLSLKVVGRYPGVNVELDTGCGENRDRPGLGFWSDECVVIVHRLAAGAGDARMR